MVCPKCGGKNVSVQLEQLSAKTNMEMVLVALQITWQDL